MIDLAAAFEAVAAALDSSGLDYVVVGSTAAVGWGVARTTRDVDLVVQLDGAAAETFLASLDRDDLYVSIDAARDALVNGGSSMCCMRRQEERSTSSSWDQMTNSSSHTSPGGCRRTS